MVRVSCVSVLLFYCVIAYKADMAYSQDLPDGSQGVTKSAEELEKEKATNPYANDLGPDSIDISGYLKEHKDNYILFKDRCAKCHTIARPINSQFSLPEEWERYVKRMMRKPGCSITPAEGKKIWQFLVYDSQQRKMGENKTKWDEHRKKLLAEFKKKYPERYKEIYETAVAQPSQAPTQNK